MILKYQCVPSGKMILKCTHVLTKEILVVQSRETVSFFQGGVLFLLLFLIMVIISIYLL